MEGRDGVWKEGTEHGTKGWSVGRRDGVREGELE